MRYELGTKHALLKYQKYSNNFSDFPESLLLSKKRAFYAGEVEQWNN
jgi:predicted DNA-binding transcriptional regulator AlpA